MRNRKNPAEESADDSPGNGLPVIELSWPQVKGNLQFLTERDNIADYHLSEIWIGLQQRVIQDPT